MGFVSVSALPAAASEHTMTDGEFVLSHNYQSCLQLAGKGLKTQPGGEQPLRFFVNLDSDYLDLPTGKSLMVL